MFCINKLTNIICCSILIITVLSCNDEKNFNNIVHINSDQDKEGIKLELLDTTTYSIIKPKPGDYRRKFPKRARILRQTAKNKIARYKIFQDLLYSEFGMQYDPANDIYGFTFSYEHLDSLLSYIKEVNRLALSSQDSLVGVRVYLGKDTKARPNGNVKFISDAFMIPVKTDGSNLLKIDDDLRIPKEDRIKYLKTTDYSKSEDPIYNRSVPCPNQCD